jgi:hypothetical protein
MHSFKMIAALLAITSLTSPALADYRQAAFASSADRPQAQASMFTGMRYRISLDGNHGQPRARASLTFAGMKQTLDGSQLQIGSGLEIAAGKTKKPALHLAGQDIGELKKSSSLDGTTTVAVVVGVLVAAAIVGALVIDDKLQDDNDAE